MTIAGCASIETIIECSKVYDDDIHIVLALKLTDDPSLTIMCHRNCGSTYTSRQQVKRFLKRKGDVETNIMFHQSVEEVHVIQTSHFCSSVFFFFFLFFFILFFFFFCCGSDCDVKITREESRALVKSLHIQTE